ncbi:gp53-like domain-containing protein [Atlantibacter hermannii]|uniref:gp53-like domain-containing protein n=1 Tax=Atlantibacter hermannii TaxID=565 RepID=UPI0028B0BB46|nr:hypothetical protein [Atlantibacter hermannii]
MALTLLAANNAQTVLAAGISSSATSITVNTGTGALFPAPVSGTSYFKLTLVDAATGSLTEIVHVTARAGDVFTIQRAREGTTARAWSANDIAANMMTAGTLDVMAQKDLSLQIANSLSEISAAGTAPQARGYLGFDALGFGLSNNALLSAFDWQQCDFTTGARYLVSSSTWTNAPSGVNYPAGTQVFIAVDGITSAGTVIELTLIANQANDANYRIYKVRIANAKGSRTFTVRQIWTSADTVPIANGGTGATTSAAARTALGLGDAATKTVGAGLLANIPDMSFFRGLMSSNGYAKIPIIGAGGGAQTFVLQWGIQSTTPGSSALYNLNVAFPNSILWATGNRGAPGSNASMNVSPEGTQQIRIQNYAPSGPNENCNWIAIGY